MVKSHSSKKAWHDKPISDEVLMAMVRCVASSGKPYIMYKNKGDTVDWYCTECRTYHTSTKEEFRKIRYARICPKCFSELAKLTDRITDYWQDVCCYNGAGYLVKVKADWGKEPKLISWKQVYYESPSDGMWVKGIGTNMGYSIYEVENQKPRQTRSYCYCSHMLSHRYVEDMMNQTDKNKREYLEKEACYIIKSNQRKLVMDNLFNPNQMRYIKMFNLKSYDDVVRNRVYMKENELNRWSYQIDERFNVETLDYLRKNKISLSDYIDYDNMCKKIGRKTDKPKDFKLWHDRVSEMVEIKKNENLTKGIAKQWKKYEKVTYSKKNIVIKAFENYEEIYKVATTLHNCMARAYAGPYSKGKTQLYHLDVEGIPTIAIEINGGEIRQARSDHNRECPPNYKRIINKWARDNNLIRA